MIVEQDSARVTGLWDPGMEDLIWLSSSLKTKANVITTGWKQQKRPGPPCPLIGFLLSYQLWTCGKDSSAHAAKGDYDTPYKESHKVWITREK